MNKKLIKELVDLKLEAANMIVNLLPPKLSEEVKELGRVILESMIENSSNIEAQPYKKPGTQPEVNSVPIE